MPPGLSVLYPGHMTPCVVHLRQPGRLSSHRILRLRQVAQPDERMGIFVQIHGQRGALGLRRQFCFRLRPRCSTQHGACWHGKDFRGSEEITPKTWSVGRLERPKGIGGIFEATTIRSLLLFKIKHSHCTLCSQRQLAIPNVGVTQRLYPAGLLYIDINPRLRSALP